MSINFNQDSWKITAEERAKHDATFNQLSLNAAFLNGEQAKAFLLKSGLPMPTLGQIWNLADLNHDGKLDKKEFSIACYLVKSVLTGATLPVTLPPSLLVDSPIKSTDVRPIVPVIPVMQSLPQSTPHLLHRIPVLPSAPPMSMPAIATPLVTVAPKNAIGPILPALRNKYTQIFQGNDVGSTGHLNGNQAKMLLIQSGLNQTILAQIWGLSDYDNDGQLSLEEFLIAMHLCEYAKNGGVLPSTLPVDLQPNKAKTSQNTVLPLNQQVSAQFSSLPATVNTVDPFAQANEQMNAKGAASFEDKRKENFDKGNAVLEAKRQMLREQTEREKREREEKDRLELEKKMKIKEEQERRRLAEIEKQMERQRMFDLQREEERKKALEQREAARNELLRQQRMEWELQRKHELENQKIKLQEQLTTLKAKDKNLEYDMQLLNDKTSSSKSKISDTQSNLSELNIQMDSIKKSLYKKQIDSDQLEKLFKDYNESIKKISQEKLYLSEQLKNLNQDNPFAEAYRTESIIAKQEQQYVQQLKLETDKLETDINSIRLQTECIKHEIDTVKNEMFDLNKENDRLTSLLGLKRNDFQSKYPNLNFSQAFAGSGAGVTASVSQNQILNQFRSATPKENYELFKEEISKINIVQANSSNTNISNGFSDAQQSIVDSQLTNGFSRSTSLPTSNLQSGQVKQKIPQSMSDSFTSNGSGNSKNNTISEELAIKDPFGGSAGAFGAVMDTAPAVVDPFYTDPFAAEPSSQNAFMDDFSSNNAISNTNNDWALFDDDFKPMKNENFNNRPKTSTSNNSIKGMIDSFNNQRVVNPPVQAASQAIMTPTQSKYKVLYNFDAQLADEMSLQEGDIVIVDTSVKSDDGWSWGMCKGRTGHFPTGFATKLTDLESIQEESAMAHSTSVQPGLNLNGQRNGVNVQNNVNSKPVVQPVATQDQSMPVQVSQNGSSKFQVVTVAQYLGKKENHLSFEKNEIITVREQQGPWWSGELNGKIGWFPKAYVKPLDDKASTAGPTQTSKSYYVAIFAFESNEPGDLNFGQHELVEVTQSDGDWYTGSLVANPKQSGIFPSSYVRKFLYPFDYINKYFIALTMQDHVAQSSEEINLYNNDLVAVTKLSGDGKWSYGECVAESKEFRKGWFPTQCVENIMIPKNNAVEIISPAAENAAVLEHEKNGHNGTHIENVTTETKNVQIKETQSFYENQQESQQQHSQTPKLEYIDQVVALYDFQSTTAETLGFTKDAIINILEKNGDWWLGELNGQRGLLPYNYVQSVKKETPNHLEEQEAQYENTNSNQEIVQTKPKNSRATSMRLNVTNEILSTETSYVNNLKTIIDYYYTPMLNNKILQQEELNIIFSNLHEIISINTKFEMLLSKRIEEHKTLNKSVHIGDLFLQYLPKMRTYSKFVGSQRYAEQFILEKMKISKEFNDMMKGTTNSENSNDFLLKKLMLLPMQRVTQYSLLIDKLLKYVPEDDRDYSNLKEASVIAVDLIKSINDEVGRKDDFKRLEWLDEHVAGASAFELKFSSATNFMGDRRLIYYGPIIKESGKELFAFLFNDVFAIIETNQATWSEIFITKTRTFNLYKNPILLDTIRSVQSKSCQANADSSFQILTNEREFIFYTSNPILKNEWIKLIQKAVQDYKEKKTLVSQNKGSAPLLKKTPIGRLLLVIMEGQDLYLSDNKESQTLYCEVKMDLQKFSTQTIENTLNPKWNSSMQFQIYDLNTDILNITVINQKLFSPNQTLGLVSLRLNDIYNDQVKDGGTNPITRIFRLTEARNGGILLKMNITAYQ